MGVFIFSFPRIVPPPAVRRFRLSSEWIGFDGSRWDLHTGAAGVVLLKDGLTGLHFPRFERYVSTSRAVPGHRRRGSRALARDVVWPLLVHADTQEQWHLTEQGFWHTIDPDLEGTWRVGVGSQYRELRLTGKFDDDHAYDHDPYLDGWAKYVLEMEAAQPYWTGPAISRKFEIGTADDFFEPGGSPPFNISRGSTFATASISNPGDVPAYPSWTAVGPLENIELGVGSVVIQVPFDLLTDEVLHIDTDPRNQTATLDGVDATEDLGFQPFAAIDRGQEQSLTVTATGAGSVTVELVPLYRRAF